MTHASNITDHIERYLGRIARGWKEKPIRDTPQVVVVADRPWDGITTYSSLGLSDHVLRLPSGKDVRQEFIFGDAGYLSEQLAVSLVLSMCEMALESHQAATRGQVVRLTPEMSATLSLEAIYCGMPVVYAEEFATCTATYPATVFVWLVPVKSSEAKFVDENGWDEFERLLEDQDPNLFDLTRSSVI